jgi:hypothetical protein
MGKWLNIGHNALTTTNSQSIKGRIYYVAIYATALTAAKVASDAAALATDDDGGVTPDSDPPPVGRVRGERDVAGQRQRHDAHAWSPAGAALHRPGPRRRDVAQTGWLRSGSYPPAGSKPEPAIGRSQHRAPGLEEERLGSDIGAADRDQ